MPFANVLGFYAFLSLIPFILLYLRRPKPLERSIPSLMFFLKERGLSSRQSFFRSLLTNMIFLLQLLALSGLALAITSPYIDTGMNVTSSHSVIVIDSSASMQTVEDGKARLDRAVEKAGQLLAGKNTIILAENIPIVASEYGDREGAAAVLASISAKDTSTNLGDAILLAGDMLRGSGTVYVLSDFLSNEGADVVASRRAVSARGASVVFMGIGNEGRADNAAIIDLKAGSAQSKVLVKNFADREKDLTVTISGGKSATFTKTVLPRSVEAFTFDTSPGVTRISLSPDDSLQADNIAYMSLPFREKINVLLITDCASPAYNPNCEYYGGTAVRVKKKSALLNALLASPDIELKVTSSPFASLGYDVVILYNVSSRLVDQRELYASVYNGTSLVVVAQEDLAGLGLDLPTGLGGIANSSATNVTITNQLTQDIDFGVVERYLVSASNNSVLVTASADGSPLLAMKSHGSGRVVYFGIMDDYGSFKFSASYPIFWNRLLKYLADSGDFTDYNFRTGVAIQGTFMDKAGEYEAAGKKVAASLLSEPESDNSYKGQPLQDASFEEKPAEKKKFNFELALAIAGSLIILAELLLLKFRGDL